jgi:hypothetical protein
MTSPASKSCSRDGHPAEYQAVFLGALQSAPAASAADYGEESARSSGQIAERFRREVIYGAFVDGRLCSMATGRIMTRHHAADGELGRRNRRKVFLRFGSLIN